jgi:hypothetical protein
MEVLELGARPCLATEEFKGAATCVIPGDAVYNVNSMKHCKGPQFNIGNIRPMDGSMMEHSAGN